ncbi:hypothetical protein F4604DRAFT_1915888 [Suillus subluteus]|nr:hypothetical protein F4604DRAFT_1915888 [Suillus subluteus]
MIVKWPEATKTILAGLSAEEKEGAKVVAEKWNNEAAPPDIQASVAKGKGADMIEHFATEMFKQAGMRVFVMSAWQNSRGKLMLGADWDGIFMPEWQQYAGNQFDVQDKDVPQIVTSKKRVPWKLLELEEGNDGWPMLHDTMGWKQGDQQHVIRSFLTRHYRMCMGTDKVKMAVPWGNLVKNQSNFFDSTYCPANVQLVEPSKMDKADATALLDFWHHRQQKKLYPTFCFKAWKDSDGDMEMLAKSFLKALRQATRHVTEQGTRKAKCDSRRQYNHEESTDGGEGEDNHQSSANDDEEKASISTNDMASPLPATVTVRGHLTISQDKDNDTFAPVTPNPETIDSTKASNKVTQQPRSNKIRTSEIPLKTLKMMAPKSAGANTRSKCLSANVENDQPTKPSKRHTAEPVSDTPAKRTRSKAVVTEVHKSKWSRK